MAKHVHIILLLTSKILGVIIQTGELRAISSKTIRVI